MIYDYSIQKQDGSKFDLSELKGKVVLIVNTATGCGFTPQYKQLQEYYDAYHEKGLEIIDIPCNQFGHQAPGSDAEITEFCTLKYNTTFPQFKKSEVNGANELPLYTYLKDAAGFEGFGKGFMAKLMAAKSRLGDSKYKEKSDIKWNFTKFLVSRDGSVVKRFEPTHSMAGVEEEILMQLSK